VGNREAIEQQRTDFVTAFNREDVEAMERYTVVDAVNMPPNRPVIRGIEALRAFWRESAS